jgi:hypothetical protein
VTTLGGKTAAVAADELIEGSDMLDKPYNGPEPK